MQSERSRARELEATASQLARQLEEAAEQAKLQEEAFEKAVALGEALQQSVAMREALQAMKEEELAEERERSQQLEVRAGGQVCQGFWAVSCCASASGSFFVGKQTVG